MEKRIDENGHVTFVIDTSINIVLYSESTEAKWEYTVSNRRLAAYVSLSVAEGKFHQDDNITTCVVSDKETGITYKDLSWGI